jgi:hypothetical protein
MTATETNNATAWKQTSEVLPNCGDQVYYRTRCYSALGYLDREELWRDSHGRLEPQDVIAWTEVAL